ncbi:hypothetical protein [Patiriisocius marinus]|uniref:BioF2-like acetyltransferase domain-containing protein n=1 Tax=Patiriisocius marinus TaxID=1397112 RepID=A0A5J4J0R4_9FLAO|nr:hypothetical protein [Patiriisocius marinus]GER60934.1 hypothetical protein ULMA_30420 [Patiriisocius marinus]
MIDIASYTFTIKTSIDEIDSEQWDAIVSHSTIYLNRNYLKALEQSLSVEHQFYYVLFKDASLNAVSAVVFQSAPFIYTKDKHSKKVLCHFGKDSQGFFSKQLLVCGNVFATGETGFAFNDLVSTSEMGRLLIEASSQVIKFQKKKEGLAKTKVILFKEFFPDSLKIPAQLLDEGFQNYHIDVNMVLPIAGHWKTFADYLSDVKAKYRTKANSVFKKADTLELRNLDASGILIHSKRINGLFENVLEQSDYRFGRMDAQTFASLKEKLSSLFIFKALFKNDLMVGFSTAFLNGQVLEANYVGIDYKFNEVYAIYQSLLYDYVNEAIELGVSSLQFGRTTELLKSSLGAVPVPMTLFARHTTSITHILMASILKKVSASPYELRKPFKADFYKVELSPLT